MKSLRNIIGMITAGFAALALGSCASTGSSRSSLNDDLYSTHNRIAIAERQRLDAEADAAEARAREAVIRNRLAQAGVYDAESLMDQIESGNIVENDYAGAYERRLRGSGSAKSYTELLRGTTNDASRSSDLAKYNLMVAGDEVWLEPKYVTSLFDNWSNPRFSVNIGFNTYDPWFSSWGYGYDPWDWRWNNGYYGWGYPYYTWGHHNYYWDNIYGPSWGYRPWWYHGYYDPWRYPHYGYGRPYVSESDRYRGSTIYSRPNYSNSGYRSNRSGSSITSSGRTPASSSGSYRSSGSTRPGSSITIGPNGSYRPGSSGTINSGRPGSSSSSGTSGRPGISTRPSGSNSGSSSGSYRSNSSSGSSSSSPSINIGPSGGSSSGSYGSGSSSGGSSSGSSGGGSSRSYR